MGSGFKDWAAGDVLTAADVDGYLMRQTVMTFADASARDTALSGVLDEGMVAYLEDTNAITVYNGSAWVSVIDSDVLTVDTANNRVGINDSTPSYALDVTGDINATGDIRIGGIAIGEWSTWSPTITPQTGSFTTVTVQFARYTVVNNLFIAQFRFTLTSVGTGNGVIYLTLPSGISLSNSGAIGGSWREQAVNGLTGVIQENGATSIDLNRYDNGVVIYAGARYSGTCTFEVA